MSLRALCSWAYIHRCVFALILRQLNMCGIILMQVKSKRSAYAQNIIFLK